MNQVVQFRREAIASPPARPLLGRLLRRRRSAPTFLLHASNPRHAEVVRYLASLEAMEGRRLAGGRGKPPTLATDLLELADAMDAWHRSPPHWRPSWSGLAGILASAWTGVLFVLRFVVVMVVIGIACRMVLS